MLVCALLLWAPLAHADVGRLDTLDSGTTDGGSYTVSAGTDRLLVVGLAQEGDPITADQVTITYGGQSMTKQVSIITDDDKLEVYIFTLDDAGITAASSTTISITNETAAFAWTAASYDGVDQTNPVAQTGTDQVDASTPNPLTGASFTVSDGSAVMAVAGNGKSPVTATWDADLTEQDDFKGSGSMHLTVADELFASGQAVTIEATWTDQNRAAIGALELTETGGGGGAERRVFLTRMLDIAPAIEAAP